MPVETAASESAGNQPLTVTYAEDGDLIQESPTPARESPEPGAEASEAEGQQATEGQAEGGEEGETQAGAESEQQPPIEEFLQDLTQREINYYSKRYPSAWKTLNDPNSPEDQRHLLVDKINSDREIAAAQAQEEPTLEESEGEGEQPAQAAAQPATPEQQQQQYQEFISNLTARYTNPNVAKSVGQGIFEDMGVNPKVLTDPNASPEDKAMVRQYLDRAPALGSRLTNFGTDLINTMVRAPEVMKPAIEALFPGFGQMYERAMFAMTWDEVRNQAGDNGEPLYPDMPAYGTKEFSKAAREAAKKIPGFDNMVFTDPKTGQVLPALEQAQLKYQTLADIISGQRVNPAQVAQAVETGKRIAAKSAQSRARGRALGSGQTTAAQTPQDDFRASIEAYNAESYSTPKR